jgi:hypothetical protein
MEKCSGFVLDFLKEKYEKNALKSKLVNECKLLNF